MSFSVHLVAALAGSAALCGFQAGVRYRGYGLISQLKISTFEWLTVVLFTLCSVEFSVFSGQCLNKQPFCGMGERSISAVPPYCR